MKKMKNVYAVVHLNAPNQLPTRWGQFRAFTSRKKATEELSSTCKKTGCRIVKVQIVD
jgi:hypothetical protein